MSDLLKKDAVKKLLAEAKKRGYLTYDEVNAIFPPEVLVGDEFDAINDSFDELGIELLSKEKAEKRLFFLY